MPSVTRESNASHESLHLASSTSTLRPGSSIHPASLVDASLHSLYTMRLVNMKISRELINHSVDQVIQTIEYALIRSRTSFYSHSRSIGHSSGRRTPAQLKFAIFVSTVLTNAGVKTPTLLTSLIYITRARPYLDIPMAEEWALERVFLGALMTASKYLNDSTLKNVHWAMCTGIFGKSDVGRIEREFLAVLDWDLGVSEREILGLWDSLKWAVEMEEVDGGRPW
ncbi:hypothetical protein DFP72DRAFT_823451 [Ephemerocybe angulata]|uniref:Cyclin N-terminal domain-containing protein n=1 Tax=Ephemerocybe angulata TaxID=980116 RepID=A0A8H6LX80_9AGAR|nr:hypothetical protein DFP72DRAFT_823451 [Tulosesus angulatus]